MIEAYVYTLLGVAAAQASPGPNLMAVASAGIGQGRRPALLVTLGISTGMLIWAVAVSFGLDTLFTTYPLSLIALKIIGGSYLLWLAFRALKSSLNQPMPLGAV
ncbi:MAG: LysE family translocator [Granulosicoccus sp.]